MGKLRSGERSCASDVLNWLEEKGYNAKYFGEQMMLVLKDNLKFLNGLQRGKYYPDVDGANWHHMNGHCGAASAPARAMFLNGYWRNEIYYLMLMKQIWLV